MMLITASISPEPDRRGPCPASEAADSAQRPPAPGPRERMRRQERARVCFLGLRCREAEPRLRHVGLIRRCSSVGDQPPLVYRRRDAPGEARIDPLKSWRRFWICGSGLETEAARTAVRTEHQHPASSQVMDLVGAEVLLDLMLNSLLSSTRSNKCFSFTVLCTPGHLLKLLEVFAKGQGSLIPAKSCERPADGHWDLFFSKPDWVSLSLGVFVCQGCSLIHRSIFSLSEIKSVFQDSFEDHEIQFISSMGNEAAKAKYEQSVPPFYFRPSHSDCRILREQWIRAKYERQEFIHSERQEPYSTGYREGFLWKRGRDNGQFLSRRFILSEREGALKYYNKMDAREPKATMRIETLNATFQPAKIGNPCGMQITYLRDNSTRNIFEMTDWFMAIRAARFHYQKVAFPGANDEDRKGVKDETLVMNCSLFFLWLGWSHSSRRNSSVRVNVFQLVPRLTRSFTKEGFMQKTGPRHTEGFKKRWFTMDDRRLMYFKDPLDAFALGEVFIGSKENSYSVSAGLPSSVAGLHWSFGITIQTPDRKFLLACESEAEQKDWIQALQRVINRPMMPQEYAVEAHFKHKP
ncbi:hypothetical protein DNTS_025255 [Danionella cerebrum]|uniref:Arf-GAP domain-containing protein n=1 Tax=Danionella cerebrum TaxID=2873325 RepID=A0A553Q1I9_9TELE|nr:hypothetical protein DNTS_025255 [Danionella translucida]